ncbi:MAG TPA: cytochrome c [Myxococcaceae bacterium]|nr:cytochrome c [Myxococcaceae bacterium]
MTRWVLAGLCVLGAGGLAAAYAQQKKGAPPEPVVMPAERIPSESEAKLTDRMKRHGADLIELTHAVTVLDRKAIAQTADRIRLDTAMTLKVDGGVVHDARFQQLDQQLRERVTELANAARTYDDATLAPAFGRTMETCVRCHVSYLKRGTTPR